MAVIAAITAVVTEGIREGCFEQTWPFIAQLLNGSFFRT